MKNCIWILLLMSACNNLVTTKKNPLPVPRVPTEANTEIEKPFANPVLILGSDFLNYFASLKMTNPGNLKPLILFTSKQSKIQHKHTDIIRLYEKTNFNLAKQLKAMKQINDSVFVLNYSCTSFATRTLLTITVAIENDTAKIILPLKLNSFMK